MGSNVTKLNKNTNMVSQAVQTDVTSSFCDCKCKTETFKTPNYKIVGPLPDPRSATRGILRTPIFLKIKAQDKTPKYLETDIDAVETNNPNTSQQVLPDLRSPYYLPGRSPITVVCSKSSESIPVQNFEENQCKDESIITLSPDQSSPIERVNSCPEVYVSEEDLVNSLASNCQINNDSCPEVFVDIEGDGAQIARETVFETNGNDGIIVEEKEWEANCVVFDDGIIVEEDLMRIKRYQSNVDVEIFVNEDLTKIERYQTVNVDDGMVIEEKELTVSGFQATDADCVIIERGAFADGESETKETPSGSEPSEIFVDEPNVLCPLNTPKNMNQIIKRKLSFTPDSPSNKVAGDRKPLRPMTENQLTGRHKVWPLNRIDDSADSENTPPKALLIAQQGLMTPTPKVAVSASRPHKALWDHENTLLI